MSFEYTHFDEPWTSLGLALGRYQNFGLSHAHQLACIRLLATSFSDRVGGKGEGRTQRRRMNATRMSEMCKEAGSKGSRQANARAGAGGDGERAGGVPACAHERERRVRLLRRAGGWTPSFGRAAVAATAVLLVCQHSIAS